MATKQENPATIEQQLKNPDMSFRGIPFWGWNCDLNHERLARQIREMKEMGFGGVTIHPREGLRVPYLQEAFMDAVRFSVDEAKKEGMTVWLYDDERWPSGNAGGFVTENPEFRKQFIRITQKEIADAPKLASYCVVLNDAGELEKYTRGDGEGVRWNVYAETEALARRYNGYTHVDSMKKAAIDRFIDLTHKKFKEALPDEFSKSVTAIFTDEPQTVRKTTLPDPFSSGDVILPWTDDFPETFQATYGADILDHIPELVWEQKDRLASPVRYQFHNHICDRFMEAFCGTTSEWCKKNDLPLTGHFLHEESLLFQSRVTGDVMRGYVYLDIPGMDILRNQIEFTTAKQMQSVAAQYGRERTMSEMYALTNWDFDFRGHKFQSDWQAALGVNIRVPSIVQESLKGYAKRDFPPFLGSHSPWYKEYKQIEDHFARVFTAMTQGKSVVHIGMIHPIESYWLHWGPESQTRALRDHKDEAFANVVDWLLFGCQDFHFINEALLAEDPDKISDMDYDVILVPDCETLRSTTVRFLEQYQQTGKPVIFMGAKPKYIDVKLYGEEICKGAEVIPFEEGALLERLSAYQEVQILTDGGKNENLICGLRKEEDGSKWLFIAHGRKPADPDNRNARQLDIQIKGQFAPEIIDTFTGDIKKIPYTYEDGKTCICYTMYDFASLLLHLAPTEEVCYAEANTPRKLLSRAVFPELVSCRREEPNVLLLDIAEYRFRQEEFEGPDEILRIDEFCRRKADLVPAGYKIVQPWCFQGEAGNPVGCVELKFKIETACELDGTKLAFEEADGITLNGQSVPLEIDGYYVDQDIHTVKLPKLMKGVNILCVEVPIGNRDGLEPMYLLGEFSVELQETDSFVAKTRKSMFAFDTTGQDMGLVLGNMRFEPDPDAEETVTVVGAGHNVVLSNRKTELTFGSVTEQGMPFYSGNLIYETEIAVEEACEATVTVPSYRGAAVKVIVDGKDADLIIHGPYQATVSLDAGVHTVGIRLYGNRNNTFGSMHNCNTKDIYYGPSHWLARGKSWTYRYLLRENGLMEAPYIELWK